VEEHQSFDEDLWISVLSCFSDILCFMVKSINLITLCYWKMV